MSNQWGPPGDGYTKNFMNKDRSSWNKPTSPPVPMPIILKRALILFEEGKEYRTKYLYRACRKMNPNVTKKMFNVAYMKWLLAGEGFEPRLHHFIRMNF